MSLPHWLLFLLAAAPSVEHPSWLKPGCDLARGYIGEGINAYSAVWLKCGTSSIVVSHPVNLLDKVAITTAEEALAYVRFFSEQPTYFYRGQELQEVSPGVPTPLTQCEKVVPVAFFEKKLKRPTAVRRAQGEWTIAQGLCPKCAAFEVTRTVLLPDDVLYAVHQVVLENGYAEVVGKERLAPAPDGLAFICVE